MADKISKKTRSKIMAAIRSKNNSSTEMKMLRLLRAEKLTGWRRHANIVGSPDFCWRSKRVALFVDGCFWHGCKQCYKLPRSNVDFWLKKITRNVHRDVRTNHALRQNGWIVIRAKECQLKDSKKYKRILKKVRGAIEDANIL